MGDNLSMEWLTEAFILKIHIKREIKSMVSLYDIIKWEINIVKQYTESEK